MTDRRLPDQHGVVRERPDLGGGAATPSFALPDDAADGLPGMPRPTVIGPRTFAWGERTFLMGVVNVTGDSFSGDGLLARGADPVTAAVDQGRRMVAEGADLLDVGGASSRPGHVPVSPTPPSPRSPRRRSTRALTCSTTSGASPTTRRWSASPRPAASRSS